MARGRLGCAGARAGSGPAPLLLLLLLFARAAALYYDTFTGKPIDLQRTQYLTANNILPWCSVDVAPCSEAERRRIDGSCNNLPRPPRGAPLTPYHRMLPPAFSAGYGHRVSSSGLPLPGGRRLRTALVSDGRVASAHYSHLLTHLLVALTGDVTSLHDTVNYVVLTTTCCAPPAPAPAPADTRCQPIPVPPDDPVFRYSDVRCLNLTRAITYQRLGCVSDNVPPERINTSPPMLDLSMVYGNSAAAAQRGRAGRGGRLRERGSPGRGRVFPPSGSSACLNNEPPLETTCHDTPNPGVNSIIGLNLIMLWFYRNHNLVARRLESMNPCWGDERLYLAARDINIAHFQHIFYYDLVPLLIGYDYALKHAVIYETTGHVNDYDETLEPRVSIEWVIGTRWFHTMQEGFLNMYDEHGALYGRRAVVDDTLRSGFLELNRTIEGLTQGSFRQPAADNDFLVDPDVGNRVLGRLQRASDVVASDIVKGRDVGLPPYDRYRRLCGLERVTDFSNFLDTIDPDKVEELKLIYEEAKDVDVMAGILVERAMYGAAVGPTLGCMMADQLRRWRRTDRFWYENPRHPGAFTAEQLYQIRKMSMARLLCDNGDDVKRVQPRAFLVPGSTNEITTCERIAAPEYDAWRDPKCRTP